METPEKILYKDRPEYQDITPLPLPQQNGDPFFIHYSEKYKDLFGYFFAFLEKREVSERALRVCEEIISDYTSNYTAWWYKFYILENSTYDFERELEIINNITEINPKCYQAWHYRQWLLDRATEYYDDLKIFPKIFSIDAKNFHAWSYLIWYAKRWSKVETAYNLAKEQISLDMRNNSAWNARKTFGDILQIPPIDEFNAAAESLRVIGKNEAAVNFIFSIVEKDNSLLPMLEQLGNELKDQKPDNSFALRILLWVATRKEETDKIGPLCDELMMLERIRIPYYSLVKEGKLKYK